jgi:hypothetical protein
VTGDFDSEFLGDILDDLDSEENQLAFEVQGVLQELLTHVDVNATSREITWEDGQILCNRSDPPAMICAEGLDSTPPVCDRRGTTAQ